MDESTLRERGEENGYPEEAIEDMVKIGSFLEKVMSFLVDLQDNDYIDTDTADKVSDLIDEFDEGIFETED